MASTTATSISRLDDRRTGELATKLSLSDLTAHAKFDSLSSAAPRTESAHASALAQSALSQVQSHVNSLNFKADHFTVDDLRTDLSLKIDQARLNGTLLLYPTSQAMAFDISASASNTLSTVANRYALKTVIDQLQVDLANKASVELLNTQINSLQDSITAIPGGSGQSTTSIVRSVLMSAPAFLIPLSQLSPTSVWTTIKLPVTSPLSLSHVNDG